MAVRTLHDLFVDRSTEIERFGKSLDGGPRRLIVVNGEAGMGKSWLLRQFERLARDKQARTALIDFSDGQAYDTLMIVRRIRDSLGSEQFNALTAAINEATAPRVTISDSSSGGSTSAFGSGNQFGNVNVGGDVAGRNIIKDNLFIIQSDNPLLLQAIEDRITQVFFECLATISTLGTVVLLFDSYDRNSQEGEAWIANAADRWLTRELFSRIRDGKLPKVIAVIAGRRTPDFGPEWNAVLGKLPLKPFTPDDVGQYLRVNRGLSNLSDDQVKALFDAVQGNPQLLGIIGDNLEQSARPSEDEGW